MVHVRSVPKVPRRAAPMMTVRRAKQRVIDHQRKREVWYSFPPAPRTLGAADEGFGVLEMLNEQRLPPGAAVPRLPKREAEILTYVLEGALAHEDSTGCSGVVHAGEFQRMLVGRDTRHGESNASRTEVAHVFQVWLTPRPGFEPGGDLKRFSVAERRGRLCLVASPDARQGSLRLQQDARVYSAVLDPGQHVVHELCQGRRAWLHLVEGSVSLGDQVLATGDGAGLVGERTVSFTAQGATEVLLLDLGDRHAPDASVGSPPGAGAPEEDEPRPAG